MCPFCGPVRARRADSEVCDSEIQALPAKLDTQTAAGRATTREMRPNSRRGAGEAAESSSEG